MRTTTVTAPTLITMPVRITAVCSFCARKFQPFITPGTLSPACDDDSGRLCCDDCQHHTCNRGHVLAEDFDECYADSAFPAGELDDFDYDAWSDAFASMPAER